MTKRLSPLRYPGGKSKIYDKVKRLIEVNKFGNLTYIEPFAGGFGIGINLLEDNIVRNVVLNDIDTHIYNFWFSILHHTDEIVRLIEETPVTLEERENQIHIYQNTSDIVSDGFATLFLNRVNYSGVIKGGPLGGYSQESKYKIDCRFNKSEIIKKIRAFSKFKDQVRLYNVDACELITVQTVDIRESSFFNIDPPYVVKGSKLYTNFFCETDHLNLEKVIRNNLINTPWIVTYDDCPFINNIYNEFLKNEYCIRHNVGSNISGKEVVITNIPRSKFIW